MAPACVRTVREDTVAKNARAKVYFVSTAGKKVYAKNVIKVKVEEVKPENQKNRIATLKCRLEKKKSSSSAIKKQKDV